MVEVKPLTRRQRRAWRIQKLVAAREAYRAALRAGLDYRVSGESGALVVHTHSLTWHRARTPNMTVPPLGRGWDGSRPVRMVRQAEDGIVQPVNHDKPGKQVAEKATVETTE